MINGEWVPRALLLAAVNHATNVHVWRFVACPFIRKKWVRRSFQLLISVLGKRNLNLFKNSHFESLIFDKIHIFKISFFTKFTFSKFYFSQNSQFQSPTFHKIHMFKISFSTKFTILKYHFSQNSHFKNLIFHKNPHF